MAQNLTELIKLCKKHGISKLKCDGIELEFGESHEKAAPRGRHVSKDIKELSPEDEIKLKEEQLSSMLIENPLQYEEFLMKESN